MLQPENACDEPSAGQGDLRGRGWVLPVGLLEHRGRVVHNFASLAPGTIIEGGEVFFLHAGSLGGPSYKSSTAFDRPSSSRVCGRRCSSRGVHWRGDARALHPLAGGNLVDDERAHAQGCPRVTHGRLDQHVGSYHPARIWPSAWSAFRVYPAS